VRPWPSPTALLPHGPAARAVDAIVEFTPGALLGARLEVRPALGLFDPARGGIPAWAGIEIMAQVAGLYLGMTRHATGRTHPQDGYLLGARRFEAGVALFPAGAGLLIHAHCLAVTARGAGRFDCHIMSAGKEQATAELIIAYATDQGQET